MEIERERRIKYQKMKDLWYVYKKVGNYVAADRIKYHMNLYKKGVSKEKNATA